MKNNLVGLIMGVVCAVVIIGSVLVPSINDIIGGNVTTYSNEGTGLYYDVDPDGDRIVITSSSANSWTMNGEAYDVSGVTDIVTTDQCRVYKNGNYLQLYDETGVRLTNLRLDTYLFDFIYDHEDMTFTVVQYADLTTTTVSATYAYNIAHIMIYDPDGDHVAYTSDGGLSAPSGYYVNSLSDIVCGGAYTTGSLDTSYFGQGETVTVGVSTYTASATATTENVLDDVLTVSDYTVTVTDGTTTETFIPYTIYVPATLEGHTSGQTTQNTLYGIIPILMIIGVVCTMAYAVMRGRDY